MKLQDAFAAETGAVGSWPIIGYIAPGSKDGTDGKKYTTTTFDYEDTFVPKDTEKNTTMVNGKDLKDSVNAWQAKAKTALNDCKIDSKWTVKIGAAGTGSTIKYTPGVENGTDCESLTANFKKIGQ